MRIQTFITVKNEFIGFHRYKNAPDEVKYLRDWHRHVFKVATSFRTTDQNREKEFFIEQSKIQNFLNYKYDQEYFEESCEMIADSIAREFKANIVTVSEDGESEGTVTYEW